MSAFSRIMEFVLERSADLPAAKRAQMYTDLSALTTDDKAAETLAKLAADCRAIDSAHDQLLLNLRGGAR